MEITKDIPARTDVLHTVQQISLNIDEKKMYVSFYPGGESHKVVAVSIPELFVKYAPTETQKTIIRTFFKYVIAEALIIDSADVPEILE